jgi:hypothetical protein
MDQFHNPIIHQNDDVSLEANMSDIRVNEEIKK